MMQAWFETAFSAIYLTTVLWVGIVMIRKSPRGSQSWFFGLMAVVLGAGDAFHLVPRAYALLTSNWEANAGALGIGKLITSITMTVFYVLLYIVWRKRYHINGRRPLTIAVIALAIVRILLCLFPQNMWLSLSAPVSWSIYRNIPFTVLGLMIICLYLIEARRQDDTAYRWIWIAVTLSFAFYVPVVLWSRTAPWVGILMIPKTMAYVWIVLIGFFDFRRCQRAQKSTIQNT